MKALKEPLSTKNYILFLVTSIITTEEKYQNILKIPPVPTGRDGFTLDALDLTHPRPSLS
jgi:hypothetical protein